MIFPTACSVELNLVSTEVFNRPGSQNCTLIRQEYTHSRDYNIRVVTNFTEWIEQALGQVISPFVAPPSHIYNLSSPLASLNNISKVSYWTVFPFYIFTIAVILLSVHGSHWVTPFFLVQALHILQKYSIQLLLRSCNPLIHNLLPILLGRTKFKLFHL